MAPPALVHFVAHLAADQAALDAMPMALGVFDEALRLRFANAKYRVLAGEVADPAHRSFPRALSDLGPLVARVRTTGVAETGRVDAAGRSGAHVVEVQAVPVPLGTARGVALIATDVTERVELNAHLAESVSQLSTAFDVLPDAVRVYDANARLVRANALAERSAPGQTVSTVRELWLREAPHDMNGVAMALEQLPVSRALRGEAVSAASYRVRRPEGEAMVEVSAVPLRTPAGELSGAVVIERDVTERVQPPGEFASRETVPSQPSPGAPSEADRVAQLVEARSGELLRLEATRARERRLAALGQLAAGVMHDVNNALNPVMLAAWLLERHADDPVKVREYAARIQKAAETGASSALRVGRFIRQEPLVGGRQLRFDLAREVAEAIAIAEPTWARRGVGTRITLVRQLDPGLVVVGAAGEVREAVLNLVQNAIDAMPDGGELAIRVQGSGREGWIEVEDSGVGMSDEVREQAFDPFFSTKGTGGSGLGLAEVYGIMRRHRGTAEVTSAPGRGTTVRARFPLAQGGSTEPISERQPFKALNILLVEDQPEGRQAVHEVLANAGHRVSDAGDLATARAIIREGGGAPPLEVVVTDVLLPDGYGWELISEVRRLEQNIRIGLITAWELAPPPDMRADFTLRKPLAATELLDRIAGK